MRRYQRHFGNGRFRLVGMIVLLTAASVLFHGAFSGAVAKQLRQSSQIPVIAAGQQGGQYSTEYFSVTYSYTRVADVFKISGTVQFSDMTQQNWNTVQSFYLGLVFADNQGNVLQEHGLSTPGFVNLTEQASVPFKNTISIPAGTAFMAFKATGQAIGDGPGNDPTPFWVDPIKGLNW